MEKWSTPEARPWEEGKKKRSSVTVFAGEDRASLREEGSGMLRIIVAFQRSSVMLQCF